MLSSGAYCLASSIVGEGFSVNQAAFFPLTIERIAERPALSVMSLFFDTLSTSRCCKGSVLVRKAQKNSASLPEAFRSYVREPQHCSVVRDRKGRPQVHMHGTAQHSPADGDARQQMRRLRTQAALRCRQLWRRASQSRWLGSARLPRVCVIVLVVAGLLVMMDLIPRMIIIASEARETAYWEAWEEAYIDKEAGATLLPTQSIRISNTVFLE